MPTVTYRGTETVCEEGEILRDVLKDAGLTPHNGSADLLNCRGRATCGTCAVAITGDDGSVSEPNKKERRRLSFPPHDSEDGLRLACQTKVYGDITVEKGEGFWGQDI